MPANRPSKQRSKISSSLRREKLLFAIANSPSLTSMKPCTRCARMKISECKVSETDSTCCEKCVHDKQGNCDVGGVTNRQLQNIAEQHYKLERELEEAEERALAERQKVADMDRKVIRLRKQKRMWYEKMKRAVSRGIDDLEELERVEREEAEQAQRSSGVLPTPSEELDPALVRSLEADFDFSSLGDFREEDWATFLGNETGQAASNSS